MTDLTVYNPTPLAEIERMADYVAKSGLFGAKSKDQAVALMMLAQAEGLHPMIAARDYDIIQGRPSKKAEAMLRDFHKAGGRVEWHQLDDTKADATFSHEQGGSYRCVWDMDRAKKAGLGGKEMWAKWSRQMLRSRCVSEGCKTVWPSSTSGMYTPEEVRDFEPMRDITPTDKPKRVTSDPLAAQAAPTPESHPEPAAKPPVANPPTGGAPSPSQATPLDLPFVTLAGEVKSCTNRPMFLSMMEAAFEAGEPAEALDCFFANQAILNDLQSFAFERHEKASAKGKADARAVLDRVNAVFETAKELQKALKQ